MIKVLVSAFYALQDTRTPVRTATVCLFVNLGLNLALMWHLKIGGLALATALAATLNAVLLFIILWKRMELGKSSKVGITLLKSLAASAVMAFVCVVFFLPWIHRALEERTRFVSGMFELVASIVLSVLIYFLASLFLRSEEAENAKHFFKHAD